MRMRLLVICLIVGLLLASCAPLANTFAAQTDVTPEQALRSLSPELLDTPTFEGADTSTPTATFTSEPFALQFTPVPTETPLPTLELPTQVANPPTLQIWDGLPTYLAESKPDFYFRLHFDPDMWALTSDNFGFPALAHRTILSCLISPSAGRGLPLNVTVEHDTRRIGQVTYDVNSASVNGVKQFVAYAGGDANIYTAFQVSFQDQADQCLTDSEIVLATLTSVLVSQATPVSTP